MAGRRGACGERACVLCVDVREAELEVGEKVKAWVCLRRPGRQCSPNKHNAQIEDVPKLGRDGGGVR